MNTKNVIRRIGIVFIFGPIFIVLSIINVLIWVSSIIWGPIYYIITGNDPLTIIFSDPIAFKLADWYIKKFGPK